MTGVMSRGVVTIGAIFLIICGFVPKIGAVVSSMPIEVLGRCYPDVWHGLLASACCPGQLDASQYDDSGDIHVSWHRLAGGSKSMQHLPDTLGMLMTSGLLPVAVLAVVMNLVLPEDAE